MSTKPKSKAPRIILGGALIILGMYLFPFFFGQELFINWLSEGRDYTRAIILAGFIGGLVFLTGTVLLKPSIVTKGSKPWIIVGLAICVVGIVVLLIGGV